MKRKMLVVMMLCGFLGISYSTRLSAAGPAHGQFVVDDDKVECPFAMFSHIQDAVNAASPGDSIRVCKGTYVEQVSINKPLDIDADFGAVLMPTAMQANTSSLFDASPIASGIVVSNTTGVFISGLTVDLANAGISECGPDLIGITFQNASGRVSHNVVKNTKLSSSLNGCQSGTGIFVQSGNGGISKVEVVHNTIHDYQKNGITGDEIGTFLIAKKNTVTGLGPTTGAAQNGVQIGFGATGLILENNVTNNVWAPCTSVATCTAVATDILVAESDGVTVAGNTAGTSQVNIFVDGNHAQVANNRVFGAQVFDGIRIQGDQSQVRENCVTDSDESGIFLAGNNNYISENTISETPIGILEQTGSTGNVISNNWFFQTPIHFQDPQLVDASKFVSPKR
jgi:nitrous oxidase accessory protein NosD